jgi:hypothetical protein
MPGAPVVVATRIARYVVSFEARLGLPRPYLRVEAAPVPAEGHVVPAAIGHSCGRTIDRACVKVAESQKRNTLHQLRKHVLALYTVLSDVRLREHRSRMHVNCYEQHFRHRMTTRRFFKLQEQP